MLVLPVFSAFPVIFKHWRIAFEWYLRLVKQPTRMCCVLRKLQLWQRLTAADNIYCLALTIWILQLFYLFVRSGWHSRYSDWLRVGRSGDRIPVGGEIFRTCPYRPWGPPSLLYNGYRVFPGGKERPGCDADPSPPSSSMVMKEYIYTSTPPMGRTACTEPQCLYRGDL